jgi:hypothetical protein
MNPSPFFRAHEEADPDSEYCYFADREATEEELEAFFREMRAVLQGEEAAA